MSGRSEVPTPYGVHCHGQDFGVGPVVRCNGGGIVYMTREEYMRQMRYADRTWRCPGCGGGAWWDDDNYEARVYGERPDLDRAVSRLGDGDDADGVP